MTAVATLRALLDGDRDAPLLGACRLESGGVDTFGGEAIRDAFRRAPVGLDGATIAEGARSIAIFTDAEAIFADLYGSDIGRLWRVGQADPGPPEPAVGMAFDPDLAQARTAVHFAPGDHPDLGGAAVARVLAAGQTIIDDASFRARAFVVRAFGDATSGAALFAVHSLAAPPVRTPSLTMAAVNWNGAAVQIVRDRVAARAGLVRIAA